LGKQAKSVERMREAGVLGPDMTFVHCNCCTDEALRFIAESGGTASVSARVEMQMGHGFPATGRLMAAGVRPSLSVDVVTSSGGNLFDEMQVALQTERARQNQATLDRNEPVKPLELSASDVLEFVTVEGARTCGLEDRVGSITPRKQADLILLRRDMPNLTPLNHLRGAVVMAAGPGNVDTVFVAGRLVKQHGKLLNCDLDRVYRLAVETRDHLFAATGVPPGSTPVGLPGVG
jgi:cytosine/adenosine deaminase-related metal-dependent hydrolase